MILMSMVIFFIAGGVVFFLSSLQWDREMESGYECGFDHKDSSRLPFSLLFFSMLVIFMLFDMELVLLMQFVYDSKGIYMGGFLVYFVFIGVIIMTTLIEYYKGLLSWFF